MKKNRAAMFILAPIAFVAFVTLGGWVVSWLWNALLTPLFGLPMVTFWQALGILALSRILFGSWGGGGGSKGPKRAHKRHHYGGPRGRFTPEERERIRQGLGLDNAETQDQEEE